MIKIVPIKKNKDFVKLYKRGKFYVGRLIVLYVFLNNSNINRIGVTVSKKVGNSVKRNRIRRLIKENYRSYEGFVKTGYDFVFTARKFVVMPDFYDIKKEMKFLLKKLDVFDREQLDCQKDC